MSKNKHKRTPTRKTTTERGRPNLFLANLSLEYYGKIVKFHVRDDTNIIPELVKRVVGYPSEEFDIDYDVPEYEVLTCERVEPEDYFTSAFAGEMYHWDSEAEEHIPWAGGPEDRREEMIEGIRDDLNGQLVLLQVELPHEHDDGSTMVSTLVDELLGYIEVREIWHHPRRPHPETRGLLGE